MSVLSIQDLRLEFGPKAKPIEILRGVSLELARGQVQGLAGESGSGKSMTAFATLGLAPANARVSGRIMLDDRNLLELSQRELSTVRGNRIAMVFQDPSMSLHPQLSIGTQLTDHMRRHLSLSKKDALARAEDLLDGVRVPAPHAALKKYPHEFSGGQRQRVAIAAALACKPDVLLADEPTTALDVTVQASILHLLRELATQRDLAVLLITHDLGVMSAVADRVAIMRHGLVVEEGERHQIFTAPGHPYTKLLLDALPQRQSEVESLEEAVDILHILDEEIDGHHPEASELGEESR